LNTNLKMVKSVKSKRKNIGRILIKLVKLILPKNSQLIRLLRKLITTIKKKKRVASILGLMPVYDQVISSYAIWSEIFDTPNIETLVQLDTSVKPLSIVYIIATFDEISEKYAVKLALSLLNSIGQDWKALFLFSHECKANITVQHIKKATLEDDRISFDSFSIEPNAEFVILINGGALPRSYALRVFADALRADPDILVAYSDEDFLNSKGTSIDPWFKPDYSPLLAKQGMLWGSMVILRVNSLSMNAIFEQAAIGHKPINEIVIKICSNINKAQVLHIRHVLFHNAIAIRRPLPLEFVLPDPMPTVSIIIPSKDRWDLLGPCLESIQKTDWPKELIEILIVDNNSNDQAYLNMLAIKEELNLIKVIKDNREFNWSRLNNIAANQSQGDMIVFINNDTEVIDPAWLKKLTACAFSPNVGAVGCKLLYPDNTVQHGGVIAGIQGVAGHAHVSLQAYEGGYYNLSNTTHEVIAVTGACLAVTHDNYNATGGFNEDLRVAFNDIDFCFTLHNQGKYNVYLGEPLMVHHESKSRGYDDTPEKRALFQSEARGIWLRYPQLMRQDPFYSPNLSLTTPYELSFAPRRRAIWDKRSNRLPRIMLLSSTHAIGHGVAVVIALQAKALLQHGYEVIVGGPRTNNDFPYEGCERFEMNDPREAATIAVMRSVDLIVAHTPPYFSVARWTGTYPLVVAYDYGEPPCDFFPDANERKKILVEKDLSLLMAKAVFAISDAIAAESRTPVKAVIPLGNSHLGRWNEVAEVRREKVRAKLGWNDYFVILNVCRFHKAERKYKGIDTYVDIIRELKYIEPELYKKTIIVLCGKGTSEDVKSMTDLGLVVFSNVTNEEMIDLYCAADAYANFSRWEGYNLGIGQALAMGLPVVASDIPAHRAFGIQTTDNVIVATEWLIRIAVDGNERIPRIWSWDNSLARFVEYIDSMFGE